MEANRTSIFDVCGTLYYSNTTADFLQYYFEKESPQKLFLFNKISNKRSLIFLYRAFVFKVFHRDLFKRARVFLLKGENQEKVGELANQFFEDFLAKIKIEEVHKLLEIELKESKVILVSNSIEPVVKAISAKMGIDFHATRLEVENGSYTGGIEEDLMGIKHKVIHELIGEKLTVVTDNKSDFKLVELAKEKYVVLHKKPDIQFWNRLKPNYIFA